MLDGGLSMCGAAAPPSQPPRPALLTPKFLAAAKSQAKMHLTSSSLASAILQLHPAANMLLGKSGALAWHPTAVVDEAPLASDV